MRIFLDANILFSAAKSAGAVRRLLEMLNRAGHECAVDTYVIEEARRNLVAKAPEGLSVLDDILSRCEVSASQPPGPEFNAGALLPQKDVPVLRAAVRSASSVLLTGDRSHFGPLYGKTIHGVKIHSPRSIAEALLR